MTRTRLQLSKQLTEFQTANTFSDSELAVMLETSRLTVFRLKRCLVEWIDLKLLKRLIMLMGE